jgi:hypothetical protein
MCDGCAPLGGSAAAGWGMGTGRNRCMQAPGNARQNMHAYSMCTSSTAAGPQGRVLRYARPGSSRLTSGRSLAGLLLALQLVEELLRMAANLNGRLGTYMLCGRQTSGIRVSGDGSNQAAAARGACLPTFYLAPLSPIQSERFEELGVLLVCPALALLGDGVWLPCLQVPAASPDHPKAHFCMYRSHGPHCCTP